MTAYNFDYKRKRGRIKELSKVVSVIASVAAFDAGERGNPVGIKQN